jgi:hypothetical protein
MTTLGWDPGLTKRRLTSWFPSTAPYNFSDLVDADAAGRHYVLSTEIEQVFSTPVQGLSGQTLPVNTGQGVSYTWTPIAGGYAVQVTTDWIAHSAPVSNAYTAVSFHEFIYPALGGGGPFALPYDLTTTFDMTWHYANPNGAARVGIGLMAWWENHFQQVDIDLFATSNWGVSHPDQPREVRILGYGTWDYMSLNGPALGYSIVPDTPTSLRVDWYDILATMGTRADTPRGRPFILLPRSWSGAFTSGVYLYSEVRNDAATNSVLGQYSFSRLTQQTRPVPVFVPSPARFEPAEYAVEMNLTGQTNRWVLGISPLGVGTKLVDVATPGATLTAIPGMLSFATNRGRQDELGQIQPGTATIVMDNADGRFSPDNAASPYHPNILPERQIALKVRYDGGDWIYLFAGYIKSWEPRDNGPADGTVTITAADWLARGPYHLVSQAMPQEAEDARVARLIDAIGQDVWPVSVDQDGAQTLLAKALADADGVQELLSVCAATRGLFFVARDGTLTYHSRFHRWKFTGAFNLTCVLDQPALTASAAPHIVLYDADGVAYRLDDTGLYTEVAVTASGAGEAQQVQADAAATTLYGRRRLAIDSDVMAAGRAAPLAAALLYAHRTPRARLSAVALSLDASPYAAPWFAQAVGLEIGDWVHFAKHQPASASIDRDMWVEGVAHRYDKQSGHAMTLQLSDVAAYGRSPWILGMSALGIDTHLTF